jgi:hypothetical protein
MVCCFPQFSWAHLAPISQKVGALPFGSHDGETGWTSAAERKLTVPCRGQRLQAKYRWIDIAHLHIFPQGFEKGRKIRQFRPQSISTAYTIGRATSHLRYCPNDTAQACGMELTIRQYQECSDQFPSCGAIFNPGCRGHYHFYFEQ